MGIFDAIDELNRAHPILVIDDSATFRALIRTRLTMDSYKVLEAVDGSSGLSLARSDPPDLILLDLEMPGWSGFETLRRLKEEPATRDVPVIVVSASNSAINKAEALDQGASDFVSKPFDPIELRARVRAALRTKSLQDLLEQRAHIDGLTGLGNRIALQERLRVEWAACRRRGCPLAVFITDLDHFKQINDRFGHYVGDEILRAVSSNLREVTRTLDFAARYGGEEFVVIAPDCDLVGAVGMAERFRCKVAGLKVPAVSMSCQVSASVGVAATTEEADPGLEAEEILQRADHALYIAKAAGRNQVRAWNLSPEWNEAKVDVSERILDPSGQSDLRLFHR